MIENKSDAFVFFGVSGDLAYKQTFPALLDLVLREKLDVPIICVARRKWSNEDLVAQAKKSLDENSPGGKYDQAAFAKLSKLLTYVCGDYDNDDTYTQLKKTLGDAKSPLFYLAIPPNLFAMVIEKLSAAKCADNARVALEKPFGDDLDSAKKLNEDIHRFFKEEQIFRIDHFLGKEGIQNLTYFHLANPLIQSSWNKEHIEDVQITMAEKFGVSDRGNMYDPVGAIKDVVQNHMLQTIACLAMEGPRDGEDLRKRRGELLQSVRTLTPSDVVRGQFKGYLDVKGVKPDSKTETFAALRFFIDNERWQDVPFYVRVGKCLPLTATEIVVRFKPLPQPMLDETDSHAGSSYVRFRISPGPVTAIGLKIKKLGHEMVGVGEELISAKSDLVAGGVDEAPPYERLLGDATRGDATLFADEESVEAAWRVVDPALKAETPLYTYESGSWGPDEVKGVLEPRGGWHNPV